jgi:hypothetical protein
LTISTIYVDFWDVQWIVIYLDILFALVTRSNSNETSAISDCYTRSIAMYIHDSVLQQKIERLVVLAIFDRILHFNHRTIINRQLRQLLGAFQPLSIYRGQLSIEKEMIIIKLLLKTRKHHQTLLTNLDLNRYLESYPIPCRL